jgi:hypothetical protein
MVRARLILLAIVLFVPGLAFAQTNVAGDWDVTIQSPQGTNTVLVTFKQDGEKVSGIFKSPQGELPFEGGSLTGSDLKFAFTINVQGNSLIISMAGKVEGESMTGKADFGGFGEGDWSAKRAVAATTTTAPTAPPATPPATTTAPPPPAAGSTAGAGGKWEVTLITPGGEFPATATLTDAAGKLTGTFGSQLGEVPVTGTLEGKALKMTMVAQTPQGEMTVVMTGEIDGDSIVNGQAEIAGMGTMPWSAKRAKQ